MKIQHNDHLERWLDGALRQYGNTESRSGLEGRILANLATEKPRLAWRWRWGFVAASAVVVCGSAIFWVLGLSHVPLDMKVAVQERIDAANYNHTGPQTTAPNLPIKTARSHKALNRKKTELAHEPRLDHFPSPRPLSPEEVVMARYVARYPAEAELVAKEQQKFDEEVQKAQQEVGTRSGDFE